MGVLVVVVCAQVRPVRFFACRSCALFLLGLSSPGRVSAWSFAAAGGVGQAVGWVSGEGGGLPLLTSASCASAVARVRALALRGGKVLASPPSLPLPPPLLFGGGLGKVSSQRCRRLIR